ncbi:hypothetical protein [Aminivibrio sp.]|jgi:hypothetical protein|uniref:hypothetical protein n=1 Tax=Aminivibrio sp. TaxID=1872489 RepID=UPI003D999CB0
MLIKQTKVRFRSAFEESVAEGLDAAGHAYRYEAIKLDYIEPEKRRRYTPDFCLANGILIEVKGRWSREDRKKHLLIKLQYPELDIRMVFSNPKEKINKGSKTTYADFCQRHGILFAKGAIPREWVNEGSLQSKCPLPQMKSKGNKK